MEIEELKELIDEKYTWEQFRKLVRNRVDADDFKKITGLIFEEIESYREDGDYMYVFEIDSKVYMCQGTYYSQEGPCLETYDLKEFWEVERATKTIEYWKNV